MPEWAYGHWKSRDVYEHQDDVEDDWRGYRETTAAARRDRDRLALGDAVQHLALQPAPVPDAPGMVRGMRDDGVRTVVWVTPWVNLESIDGQRPPDAESERLHREPAENYAEGAEAGHYVRSADGDSHVGRWWMGTGSIVDFTSGCRPATGGASLARHVFELGVEGVKADDGEGYYFPPDAGFADGRTGAEAAWEYGRLYRETTQEALDEVHGEGTRRRLRPLGLDRPAGDRDALGRRPGLGLLVAARPAHLAADRRRHAASPTSRTTSAATSAGVWPSAASPSCSSAGPSSARSSPLMQAHGRFQQEAWTYDGRVLDLYREAVLLHERLVPYIRAAAATAARTRPADHAPALPGRPRRPGGLGDRRLLLPRPSLWVAPVLEDEARPSAGPTCPAATGSTGGPASSIDGGRWIDADAPLERIPLWVRVGLAASSPTPRRTSREGWARRTRGGRSRRRSGATPRARPRERPTSPTAPYVALATGEWSVTPERELRTEL